MSTDNKKKTTLDGSTPEDTEKVKPLASTEKVGDVVVEWMSSSTLESVVA